jgi:hypothetical protein
MDPVGTTATGAARPRGVSEMKRMKKAIGVLALVADLALMMTGCVTGVVDFDDDYDHSGNAEVSASFSQTVALGSQTGILINGSNGSIKVWGLPGAAEIVVDAVRRVRSDTRQDAEDHLPLLRVSVEDRPHEVEIKTVQPSHTHGRTYIVDFEITVPAHLVHTVANGNGSIRLEGIQADVEVTNGNGEVTLLDQTGSSWVSVGNGEIAAWTFLPAGGQIVHSIGNGKLFLSVQQQVSASFGAKVGNGTIKVTGLDLQQVASTPRQLRGILGSGNGLIDLSAGNGQITVQGR